jgi:MFS family permease
MKRTVLTFGLIAGAILAVTMAISAAFMDEIGFDRGAIIGYTTMVLAFLMTFFGIRSYRDNIAGGAISFGRALGLGLMITIVAALCYVATWEVIYYKFAPDFGDKYAAYSVEKTRKAGATQAEIDAKTRQMSEFKEMYRNPFVNAGLTFLEPLPVGLLIAAISAGVLRRKTSTA